MSSKCGQRKVALKYMALTVAILAGAFARGLTGPAQTAVIQPAVFVLYLSIAELQRNETPTQNDNLPSQNRPNKGSYGKPGKNQRQTGAS